MLTIVAITVAVAALLVSVAGSFYGGLRLRRLDHRTDDLAQDVSVLSVAEERTERCLNDLRKSTPETMESVTELRKTLEDLEARFTDVEAYAGVCVPPKPSGSGLNINRRVEAVRLLQEGKTEEAIAEDLGIALSEVRLIAHLEKSSARPTPKRGRRVA
jgi:hypothetical protein